MTSYRCFTCNAFLGEKYTQFLHQKDASEHYKELLDQLAVKRICCRRMVLSFVDITDFTLKHTASKHILDNSNTIFDAQSVVTQDISCD